MFKKSQYEIIEKCLRQAGWHEAVDDNYREGWHAALSVVTGKLAFELAKDSATFDRARFLKACGVQS